MKTFNYKIHHFLILMIIGLVSLSCEKEIPIDGNNGTQLPENFGILEVEFKLPAYATIQSGIRRVDLALCYSMDEMYRQKFFYHSNVSDSKQVYQIQLPEGQYFYQVAITCTCGGDSCIQGGFPYGYGGLKFAFDKVDITKGKITRSLPTFQ
jgi:hypothetical protein